METVRRSSRNPKSIFELAEKNKELFKINKLNKRSYAHFVSVDGGRLVRVEEFHEYKEPQRRAYRMTGADIVGPMLQEEFNYLKTTTLNS